MSGRVTRRRALKLGAASAALPLVHIRTAGAAGKLKLALWDHWVPSGDAALQKIVDAWAEKNKVEVQLDFLTAIGEKPVPGTIFTPSICGQCTSSPTD